MRLESSPATHTLAQVRYTIRKEDKDRRLYLASTRDSACSLGQRVLVSVDGFKQGTLAEVVDLVEKETYLTEVGATHLVERIWCFEDHCPAPAMGFYEVCVFACVSPALLYACICRYQYI